MKKTAGGGAGWLGGLWVAVAAASLSAADGEVPATVLPGDRVAVVLASGRRMTGSLDARSSERTLWIRWDIGAGYLLRPVEWSCVTGVEHGGRPIEVGQLRGAIGGWAAALPGGGSGVDAAAGPASGSTTGVGDERPAAGDGSGRGRGVGGPVRSVGVEVAVANWDGDVETDGLTVALGPLDSAGHAVAARGVLQVQLFAERVGVVERVPVLVRQGRWVRPVGRGDYSDGWATFRLPFQGFHPEVSRRWGPYGVVHVRFAVPGEGVFEATEDLVRLRPYSALRDRYEQGAGRRFLPYERVGRGPR